MPKVTANIIRNTLQDPLLVEITRKGRTLKVSYDPKQGMVFDGPQAELPEIADILKMTHYFSIPSSSRPKWYDRNPKTRIIFEHTGAIAPHAETIRDSYVVPTDRMAIVQNLQLTVIRVSAGAPVGNAYITTKYIEKNVTTWDNWYVTCGPANNAGDRGELILSECAVLQATDNLDFYTGDDGTAGTVDYLISGMITEFDA